LADPDVFHNYRDCSFIECKFSDHLILIIKSSDMRCLSKMRCHDAEVERP